MVKNLNTIDRGTKIRLGRWHNDDQADNTIVINASDTPINASNANALYMKPIRSDPSNNTIMTGFDPNTYEIVNTGLRRDDVAPREVDYYANIGNTFTSTIKFEGDTSLTTEGVVGIANVQPIHTLDVGTKFYVDENGANVLTVLGDTYVQDDVVIGGNLDVRGTLTSINTENTTIKDAIIELGKGNTSSDIGIIMDRPDTNVVMGYRDTVDEFVIAHTTSSSTSSTITPSSELIDARIHGRLHVNSNLTVDTDTLHVDAIRDRVGINTLTPQTDLDVVGSAHVHSDFNVDTDTLFVDASTDRVGINTLTPSTDFHVEGETYVSGNVTVDTDTFHVDTVNDRVGINTLTPTTDFHVEGDTYVSGNVDVQTNLNVLTDAVVTGNVDVQTDLNIIGNVYATSNIVTTGNVDVQTNLNVATDAIVSGNVDVQTDLNVVGNAYVSSNAVVTGNVDVQSELNVLGNAEIQTDLTVVGNAYVSSNATVTGNVDVQTDLNVVGNAYVSSNAIVTGNVDVQTDLNVVGNTYLTSNAIITGNADVQTDLNVVGNAYLTSNAIVSGNVDVQTNLNVATDAIVTGNVDVQTDLNVVGNTYLSSNAIVTGNVDVQTNLNVATDAIVTGNVDVQTDLNVVGNAYITSNAVVTGNVDVQTNLNVATDAIVTGNVDVQTDLNVVGNAYITSNAIVTGNVDVQTNLNVATDAIVTGNVDVQTDLNVVGDVYASSNIVTTGNVDVQTNLNVATDAIVTGNVDVQTDLNVVGNAYISSNTIVTGNVDVQSDLNVAGDAYVTTYYGDGGLLSNVNLQVVSDHGNTTSSTVQFTNATTGLVTTSNVEVGDRISIGNLTVDKIPIVGTGNFLENSTIGRSNGTIVISSDLEVLGDIIVDGNSYTVESNNLVISDRIIGIANNNVSHELDVGIIMEHPGKNIALIHHGEAQGDEDPHDHTFTIGYTQNTLTDNHIFDDSNLITVEILGNLITQNNLTVSENITVVGTTKLQDSVGIANTAPVHDLDVGSNLYVEDTGSNVLHVTGNVYATRFIGDGAFLENIASNLQQITDNGNVTTNTVQFDGSTALVTTGKVGVSNTAPVHDLDVGSNLYVEDQGSNVLHVTGNVYATRFIGDGAFLENIASNLHEITTNGNVTTNTVQFDGSTALVTTGKVGISNANPTANLHVTGNAHVSGELEVLRLIDAGQYSRTRIGSGSGGGTQNMDPNQIAIGEESGYTGQREDAIAIGQKAGYTGQGTNTVAIGHNAGQTDQRPNAVAIGFDAGNDTQGQGSIAIGDSAGEITQDDSSIAIGRHAGSTNQGRMAVAIGTWAGQVNQPDNSIVINASGQELSGSISNAFYVDPIRENSGTSLLTYNPATKEITQNNTLSNTLTVTNGLVTNLGGLTKKTYGYSGGTISASTTPEINVVFESELFSAKITAHLVEPTSNISVLNLDVTGATGRNIGKGFLSIVGDQNSKHWNSTINTTNTTVTLTPSVGLLSDGTYGVHVEYTSSLGTGGVTSIDKNNINEITFDY